MNQKILIVEDDTNINRLLMKILKAADYQTIQAFSGTEALLLLEKEMPDLILLDLMLPGLSGEELLQVIRADKKCTIPVIIISAKNSLSDKVNLLKNGADDYMTKPFEPEEVIARVEANLRRNKTDSKSTSVPASKQIITYKELKLDPSAREVYLDQTKLTLTAHEFDLLFLLMQHPEKVYSRENLYELVWQGGYYGENNTVNVHVSNLRKKMKEIEPNEEYIQTVYGIGFKLQ